MPPVDQPLGVLFVAFQKYAERSFSDGTSLSHILNAEPRKSNIGCGDVNFGHSYFRFQQIRAAQHTFLVKGLAIYLFDKFLNGESKQIKNVFLGRPSRLGFKLGSVALTSLGEHDFGLINWNVRSPEARGRLIEIAETMSSRYSFVDTRYWQVKSVADILPLDDAEDRMIFSTCGDLAGHAGEALVFRGAVPNFKAIQSLMGMTARPAEQHKRDLVNQLHGLRNVVKDGLLYQKHASDRIGVGLKTRLFPKIWKLFRSELTPEQRDQLPKPGAPKRTNK